MSTMLNCIIIIAIITSITLYNLTNTINSKLKLPYEPFPIVNVHGDVTKNTYESINNRWKYVSFTKEKLCLAKNLFFEARGEKLKGLLAVALVTFNRVKSKQFPDSICEVVWQKRKSKKTGLMVAQFSWTLDDITNTPHNNSKWKEIYRLVDTIMNDNKMNNIVDFTKGAKFYHNHNINPLWNKRMVKTLTLGNHIFYIN